MTITLYVSKRTDTDLFAYLLGKKKRSTLIKGLLRDYIHHTSNIQLCPVNVSYEQLQTAEKKSFSIPIMLTEEEHDIIDFLSDCPKGTKSICIKNILRMYINPYVQNVFHTTERELYLPTAVAVAPPVTPVSVVEQSALLGLLQVLSASSLPHNNPSAKEEHPKTVAVSLPEEEEEEEEEENFLPESVEYPNFSRNDAEESSVSIESDIAQEDALLDILGVDFG